MNHVLVVEDDRALGELVCDALAARGLVAERVDSDIAAYRRIPLLPTLAALIVDVNLGAATTGFDVARFARQVIPHIAVVFMSGGTQAAAFRAHGVPDSDFLQKPFRPGDLAGVLASRLAAKRD